MESFILSEVMMLMIKFNCQHVNFTIYQRINGSTRHTIIQMVKFNSNCTKKDLNQVAASSIMMSYLYSVVTIETRAH